MENINITINGTPVVAEAGMTVLQAARANDIDIPSFCQDDSVKAYGGCGMCLVEVEGVPKLLRSCSTTVSEGMSIHTHTERVVQARKIALELLMSDHEGDCKGPCTLNCPAGTDCQGYVKQIALGNEAKAIEIIKEKIPMPSSIGRICPHPCEQHCRRAFVEQPISICALKAYAGDVDRTSQNKYAPHCNAPTGRRIAVVGGGPGGLTAAYYLAQKGHGVTVFDAMPEMGGMLRFGIPEYRLPKNILDDEISHVGSVGVTFKNNIKIGKDITLERLKMEFDAIVLAIGAWSSIPLKVDGADLEGVFGGIDFLREVALGNKPVIGNSVAIVGGGNTAMDACRTAVRLGAEKVYVVYRRTREEMPAEDIEIDEAIEEGVEFKFLTNPAEIIGEGGKVKKIKLQVMKLGEPDQSGRRRPVPVEDRFEYLEVDSVIMALGQKVNAAGFEMVQMTERGTIAANETTYLTSVEGVFAVGDATNRGASIAIDAIAEGGKAAKIVHGYLNGYVPVFKKPFLSFRDVSPEEYSDREKAPRVVPPKRSASLRKLDFEEVSAVFTRQQARAEAKRCLECGCHEYKNCELIRCANAQQINPERFAGEKHPCFTENKLVAIERNQGKCILCGLCVRTCDEVANQGILGMVGRGFNTVIKPEFNNDYAARICANCKKCAEACPTGALKIIETY